MNIIILMGVSGCGKSTVGEALGKKLGWIFHDGDDFHPQANIDKMSNGIPLNDEDRQPWLDNIRDLINQHLQSGESAIIACSALKESYRQRLKQGCTQVVFIYLHGTYELIRKRMQERKGHYMKKSMLLSQLSDLEKPGNAIEIEINNDISTITDNILKALHL